MIVTVYGPNLPGKDSGRLHVHSNSCQDPARRPKVYGVCEPPWQMDVETVQDLVEDVYAEIIDENPGMTWEDYEDQFDIFPCAGITLRENPAPKEPTMTSAPSMTTEEARSEARRLKLGFEKFLERATKKGIHVSDLAPAGEAALAAAKAEQAATRARHAPAPKKAPKAEPTDLLGRAHALRNESNRKLPAALHAKTIKLSDEELASHVKGLRESGTARTWTDAFVLTYWMYSEDGTRVATSEGKIKALWNA